MFTKLHKEERELLFKTNSVVAYEVYMHLKDKYSYFKAECYDLTRCISDYLDVPERTIKDAIKRLKTVGLISTTKKGKVNIYNFPILNKIEGKEIKEDIPTPQPIGEEKEINDNTDDNMGTFTNIIQKENGTFEKIDLPRENEMLETLLSDEELIEYVANKFIKTEGEDGYNMFVKLNNTDPKSDEFRVLTNKWLCKWGRYITTEKRNVLSGKITDIVCRKYYQRYKEVA